MNLSDEAVTTKPVGIDWTRALGEDLEGWRAYVVVECDGCEKPVVVGGIFECEECPECGAAVWPSVPMMNYYYPVDIDDVEEAARQIEDWPLCVVEFSDGSTALALTGGGMDLSWEICGAYISLGYLPPAAVCTLPRMGGWKRDSWRLPILEAAAKSCAIAAQDGQIRQRRAQEMLEAHRANNVQ